MNSGLISDEAKCRLFIDENTGWQNILHAQAIEIPLLLASAVHTQDYEGEKNQESELCKQLVLQHSKMKKLNEDIEVQQKRLANDCATKSEYDMDAFCTQDILRDRIKEIEKAYFELKCNFLNHVATIS